MFALQRCLFAVEGKSANRHSIIDIKKIHVDFLALNPYKSSVRWHQSHDINNLQFFLSNQKLNVQQKYESQAQTETNHYFFRH